jgi:hypothetical protein
MAQTWRFGILGYRTSCLIVRFTLMKALTVDQFKAVIAHEIAHLSDENASLNTAVGRLQSAFARLNMALNGLPQWVRGPLRLLHRIYTTALRTRVIPLLRSWEFRADEVSAHMTSPRTAAQALLASQILKIYLVGRYWPRIFGIAKDLAEPIISPFSTFEICSLAGHDGEVARWQRDIPALGTSPNSTHPCMRHRLEALGENPNLQPPAVGQEADQLLGGIRCRVASALDAHWRQSILPHWRRIHQNIQRQKDQLQQLRSAALTTALDEIQAMTLASLEDQVGAGASESMKMRLALRERFPHSPAVKFALGRQLLQNGIAEGAALIEGVIAQDPNALLPGADLLRQHYQKLGEESLAVHWQKQYALGRSAHQERRIVLPTDQIAPHHLQSGLLETLRAQPMSIPYLKRAYLVRKSIQSWPPPPLLVLGFRTAGFLTPYDRARAELVAQAIRTRVKFPEAMLVINVDENNARLAARFRRLRGARVI